MSWTYSNWRSQTTPAAQLAQLKLHIQEVTDAISADISADGKSRSSGSLTTLLAALEKRFDQLVAAGAVSGGTSYLKMRRTR